MDNYSNQYSNTEIADNKINQIADPMNNKDTLTNQYLEQLNRNLYTQNEILFKTNQKLERLNSKLAFIIFWLLLPLILFILAVIISALTGISILNWFL